tara:strand:+ start:4473 stop:6845 length:2373 start_codon:yes stop_codon:yes gene_type:complete
MLAEEKMKKKYHIIILLTTNLLLSYIPQTITGKILDINSEAINNVFVYSQVGSTKTDEFGNFVLQYKTKEEIVTIEKIGFQRREYSIEFMLDNNTIILERKSIKLNDITIRELSGDISKQKTANDIQIINSFNNSETHFDDVIRKVPNLNYAGGTSRQRFFQIRGIGERSQYAGEGGPMYYVGTVIDNIDLSGIGMGIFLDDVNQIEVFQGPQSYAYGHNSMAGLINVNTNNPSNNKNRKFKLTIGNDNLIKATSSINLPRVINVLQLNHFLYLSKQDGFMYNSYLNDYKNNKNEFLNKFKIQYNNNSNFNSLLTIINSNLDNGYDSWSVNNNPDTTYTNDPGNDSQELFALSLNNKLIFNNFELNHISSYINSEMLHSYDSDWGNDYFWSLEPYNVDGWSNEYTQSEKRKRTMLTQEFRTLNKIQNNFFETKFTNGFFYKKLTEEDDAIGWILGGEDAGLLSKFNISNSALYSEIKTNLNNFLLSINGRYEKVDIDYTSTHFHEYYNYYTYYTTYDTSYVDINIKENLLGGKISLSYSLNENTNLFISGSRGFKASGVNQNPRLSVNNRTFKPEYNNNIDIGYRYADDQLGINFVAFNMNRKDLQVSLSSQQDPTNPNSFYFYTSNASTGNNYGFNFDLKIKNINNIESYVNFGYLKTKIDSYTYFTDEVTEIEFSQREAAHAPRYSFSMGLIKHFNNIILNMNIEGKDKFYFSDSHDQISKPYILTNFSFDYKLNSSTTITLWSKNLFNKKYATRGFYFGVEPPAYEDKLYVTYGDPFTIGLSINLSY